MTAERPTGAGENGRAGRRPGGTAAVVVNYESGPLLARCVVALVVAAADEVVVVDNGSSDGSLAAAEATGLVDAVVRPGRNVGYGAGANRGVAVTRGDVVLVCNPDVEVSPEALVRLVDALDRDPGLGLVGPLIRATTGERYPSARRFPSLLDAAGHALLGLFAPDNRFTRAYRMDDLAESGTYDVDWVSGACFVVRRGAFEQVGGFDESYFMYAEDVDLCWRLGRRGWRIGYVTDAEAVHVQGVSTARHPYAMLVHHHVSLFRFAARSSTGWRRLALPAVAAGLAVRAALAFVHHWAGPEGRHRSPHRP